MTVLSLADGCRLLGIDAKTLHRWLAHAQLPLQHHPHDGRKTGLSSEHVRQLATLHHRSLSAWPQAEQSAAAGPAPLPAALLALPERLCTLQAQIATVQQQVATLTHLLQPARPAAPVPQTRASKQAPPAPLARRATSAAATPPRKPVHVIPRVEWSSQGHYVVICPKHGVLPLEPDTPEWFAWVAKQSSFRFVGKVGHFSAHHEWRVPRGTWRAHRHIRNHSYTLRLAPTHDLTIAVLEQTAQALQAHLT